MSNSYYLNPIKELLRVVNYPHIGIMSDENLNEMLFKSGNARLEMLRWLFCQIDEESYFTDEKLKEELENFAVNFGLCNIRESKSLVWGEPSCHAKRQFDFWRLVLETVRDVKMFRLKRSREEGEKPKPGEFLHDLAKSGALEDLIQSTSSINICPGYLDLNSIAKPALTSANAYQYQNDRLKLELQDNQHKLDCLREERPQVVHTRSPVSASIVSEKIEEMMARLENTGSVLTSVLHSLPKSSELGEHDAALKTSLDLAAESGKDINKLLADNKVLRSLSSDTGSYVPAPVKHPEILNYFENNITNNE